MVNSNNQRDMSGIVIIKNKYGCKNGPTILYNYSQTKKGPKLHSQL